MENDEIGNDLRLDSAYIVDDENNIRCEYVVNSDDVLGMCSTIYVTMFFVNVLYSNCFGYNNYVIIFMFLMRYPFFLFFRVYE